MSIQRPIPDCEIFLSGVREKKKERIFFSYPTNNNILYQTKLYYYSVGEMSVSRNGVIY